MATATIPDFAVYDEGRMSQVTPDQMATFHRRQEEAAPQESITAILKKYDLVWTHRTFEMDDGPVTKMFLAKKCKKTGELVDLPADDAMGPGKMTILMPYSQAALVSIRPENFWGLEEPNESVVMLRPEDDGYNPTISDAYSNVVDYLRKVWNHDRAVYCAKHEKELNFYPTYAGGTESELRDALLDAMSKGQEANLAHAKHPDKLGSKIFTPDWSKRHSKEPSRDMNRSDQRVIAMLRKFYADAPEATRADQNKEAVDRLEDALRGTLESKDNKFMTLSFVRHKDRRGDDISRLKLMADETLTKHAVIATRVSIGAVRVSQYKKDEKPKRGKKDKPGFKNVTLPIELSEIHWLANGKPWGKAVQADLKYDMDGVLPGDDPVRPRSYDMGGVLNENGKRKMLPESDNDSDDNDETLIAAEALVNQTNGSSPKRSKPDDMQPADPED